MRPIWLIFRMTANAREYSLGGGPGSQRNHCGETPAIHPSSYCPTGKGGRGASLVPASGSWRSICSRVDNAPGSLSAAGDGDDGASATGRDLISTVAGRLESVTDRGGWAAIEGASGSESGIGCGCAADASGRSL